MSQYPPDQPPQWNTPQQPSQYPQQSSGQEPWQQPYPGYSNQQQSSGPPQQDTQYPQQPSPGYPLQYPQQPPKKKNRTVLWIVLGVVAVLLIGGVASVAFALNAAKTTVNSAVATVNTSLTQLPTIASGNTPAATTAAAQGNWTTTQTFTGNGTKKTAIFTVPSDWKIVYSCNGMVSGIAIDGILTVSVYGSDATILDPAAVNATCKSGSALTKGETEEHQAGSIYLDITGTGDWTVLVQVPK